MVKSAYIMNLDKFIQNQGWSMYGIVSFEEIQKNLEKHETIFKEWLKKGYEADMSYLEKMEDDRFHPENKLTDVKSVIVLGALYADSGLRIPNSANKGVIAKYAAGKDYHKVLKKKLIGLSNWLKSNVKGQMSNVETYASVDSGPTVDRVLAETAGLGFFGKNCNIINPKMGSFFFIASLMTNLELLPTEKMRMPSCGDCRKCMDACPTGAIISPGVIDARKCISYLTIENKGDIPKELHSKIGNHLFGCDECQNCCPFNQRKQKILIDEFKPENGVGESLDPEEVLSIKTDEEFIEKFAGTPLMRAKLKGLQRNARIVIKSGKLKNN